MEINQYFYGLAKISASKAAEKGIIIDPKWIYTQWHIETSGFTSSLQASHHNLGGIVSASGKWVDFKSYEDFADYFGRYLVLYAEDGIGHSTSLYTYLSALHHGGYFSVDLNTYYQICLNLMNSLTF